MLTAIIGQCEYLKDTIGHGHTFLPRLRSSLAQVHFDPSFHFSSLNQHLMIYIINHYKLQENIDFVLQSVQFETAVQFTGPLQLFNFQSNLHFYSSSLGRIIPDMWP